MARHSISEGVEAAKARQKKVDASPDRAAFESEFGKDKIKDEGNGDWSLTLHDRDDIKRAHQMQDGARKHEVERGAQLHAKNDGRREKVVRRDGHVLDFPEDLIDIAKSKFRPAGRNGGAPSVRFGLSDSFGRYEQGPDGLWFVWDGGWEPTSLFTRDKQLADRQRDPNGNVWVKVEGEWVLSED